MELSQSFDRNPLEQPYSLSSLGCGSCLDAKMGLDFCGPAPCTQCFFGSAASQMLQACQPNTSTISGFRVYLKAPRIILGLLGEGLGFGG